MHQNAESDSQGPSPSAESPTQAKREDFSLQMQLTYGTSHTVPTEMGPYPREESLHRITTPDKRLGLDDTNVAQGAQQPRDEQLRLRGVGCGPPAPGAGAECALLSGSATGSWGGAQRRSTLGPLLGDPSGNGTPRLHKAVRGRLPSRPEDQALQVGATRGGPEVCRQVHGTRGESSGLGGGSGVAPAHGTPASGVPRPLPRHTGTELRSLQPWE